MCLPMLLLFYTICLVNHQVLLEISEAKPIHRNILIVSIHSGIDQCTLQCHLLDGIY
jgi:hypothetical protein